MLRTAFDERLDRVVGRIRPATDPLGPNLHWLVRATYAATFLAGGLPTFRGGDPGGFAATLGASGTLAQVVAGLAVAAGLLLLVGGARRAWATRLAGLAAAPVALGLGVVAWPRWRVAGGGAGAPGGMEFPLLLLSLALLFAVQGNKWGQG